MAREEEVKSVVDGPVQYVQELIATLSRLDETMIRAHVMALGVFLALISADEDASPRSAWLEWTETHHGNDEGGWREARREARKMYLNRDEEEEGDDG